MNAQAETDDWITSFQRYYTGLGYGDGHLHLLCHAAFPIAVTPDLIYRIWLNFPFPEEDEQPIGHVIVSDVLLWSAWRETTPQVFELPEDLRNNLLERLVKKSGAEQLTRLAQFLFQYLNGPGGQYIETRLRQTQLLGAVATLAPGQVGRQLAKELTQCVNENNEPEIFRLRNLIGALASQNADFNPLLRFAKGLKASLLGMDDAIQQQLGKIATGEEPSIYGLGPQESADNELYLTIPMLQNMGRQLVLPTLTDSDSTTLTFVLTVGIDKYKNSPLYGCANDAQALLEAFNMHGALIGSEVISELLLNEEATKEAILDVLETWLRKAKPTDLITLAFSGHGQNAGQLAFENSLFAYDATATPLGEGVEIAKPALEARITESEFRRLFSTPAAQDPYVFLLTDTHNGNPGWLNPANPKHVILTAGSNWDHVMETSYRNRSHGAFTMALLEALETLEAGKQTYRTIIRKIFTTIQKAGYEQTPQLLGVNAALNRPFLSNNNSNELYLSELIKEAQSISNSQQEPLLAIEHLLRRSFQPDLTSNSEKIRWLEAYISAISHKEEIQINVLSATTISAEEEHVLAHYLPNQLGVRYRIRFHLLGEHLAVQQSSSQTQVKLSNITDILKYGINILLIEEQLVSQGWFHKLADLAVHYSRFERKYLFPILLSECQWQNSALNSTPVYPLGGIGIRHWPDQEAGWKQVAIEICQQLGDVIALMTPLPHIVAQRGIGHIISGREGRPSYAGILIAEDLLLTSHVALPDVAAASAATLQFESGNGPVVFVLRPEIFFQTGKDNDYTMVSVAPSHASILPSHYHTLKPVVDFLLPGTHLWYWEKSAMRQPHHELRETLAHKINDTSIQLEPVLLNIDAGLPLFTADWQVAAIYPSPNYLNIGNKSESSGWVPNIYGLLITAQRETEVKNQLYLNQRVSAWFGKITPNQPIDKLAQLAVDYMSINTPGYAKRLYLKNEAAKEISQLIASQQISKQAIMGLIKKAPNEGFVLALAQAIIINPEQGDIFLLIKAATRVNRLHIRTFVLQAIVESINASQSISKRSFEQMMQLTSSYYENADEPLLNLLTYTENIIKLNFYNIYKGTSKTLSSVLKTMEAHSEPVSFPAGISLNGKVKWLNLLRLPHILIEGDSGSGKSTFLYSIIRSLSELNSPEIVQLVLIDLKKTEFDGLQRLPHLYNDIIDNFKKTIIFFEDLLNRQLPRRNALLKNHKCRSIQQYQHQNHAESMPFIVIIIDELSGFAKNVNNSERKLFNKLMSQVAQRHKAGIHLVIATQPLGMKIIPASLKSQIDCRIAFRVMSNLDSREIIGEVGAEALQGTGDMFLRQGKHLVRLQGFFAPLAGFKF